MSSSSSNSKRDLPSSPQQSSAEAKRAKQLAKQVWSIDIGYGFVVCRPFPLENDGVVCCVCVRTTQCDFLTLHSSSGCLFRPKTRSIVWIGCYYWSECQQTADRYEICDVLHRTFSIAPTDILMQVGINEKNIGAHHKFNAYVKAGEWSAGGPGPSCRVAHSSSAVYSQFNQKTSTQIDKWCRGSKTGRSRR